MQPPHVCLETDGISWEGKKGPTGDLCDRKDVLQEDTSTQKEDRADQRGPTTKTESVVQFAVSVTVSQQVSGSKMALFGFFFSNFG